MTHLESDTCKHCTPNNNTHDCIHCTEHDKTVIQSTMEIGKYINSMLLKDQTIVNKPKSDDKVCD